MAKLAGMVCNGCGAPWDTSDPRWKRHGGADVHLKTGGPLLVCGVPILRRSPERDEVIADERAALREAQGVIDEQLRPTRRRRELLDDLNRRR